MALENNFGKQDSQKDPLETVKNAEKAAYREMRDSISGEKLDYIDTKMKATLNAWANMDLPVTDVKKAKEGFMRGMASIVETARDELSREMRTPEDRAERRASLQKRFNDFAKIAKKHGFDVES